MFNLIFEELMVSVLSHRWESTAHPQDCQGVRGKSAVREWDVPFWLHPEPKSSSLGLGPGKEKLMHRIPFPSWGSLCHIVWKYTLCDCGVRPLKTSILMAGISNLFCIIYPCPIQPLLIAESHHPEWKAVVIKYLGWSFWHVIAQHFLWLRKIQAGWMGLNGLDISWITRLKGQ